MEELNYIKRYILLILVSPIVLIFMMCLVIKYGTAIVNTKELIIDTVSPIKVGDYLYYYFTILGIEITALLSFALLRTSVKSTNLARAINDKEEKRDNENLRESALMLYYDLIFKIGILRVLYIQKSYESMTQEVKKIIINPDWMKHIVTLRNELDNEELYKLIDLYNNFLLLHEFMNNDNKKQGELRSLVEDFANKIFIPVILEYIWMDFSGEIESILNVEYFMIYRKIQLIIHGQSKAEYIIESPNGVVEVKRYKGQTKYNGEFVDGKLKNGSDQWENKSGQFLYLFKYENNNIIEGEYHNKINGVYELVFHSTFNNQREQINGETTLFYDSNNIKYQGEICNGKYNGKGNLYFDNKKTPPQFSGTWKDGKMLEGEYINKSSNEIKYFKGEYKNGIPYSRIIEIGDTYEFNGAFGFKGIIQEGKLADGTGYKFNQNYYNAEFLKDHPEIMDDENEYDIEQEEIPEDVQQEIIEHSIRSQNEMDRDFLLENCGQVVELIEAKWVDCKCQVFQNDSIYKKYFGLHPIKNN